MHRDCIYRARSLYLQYAGPAFRAAWRFSARADLHWDFILGAQGVHLCAQGMHLGAQGSIYSARGIIYSAPGLYLGASHLYLSVLHNS